MFFRGHGFTYFMVLCATTLGTSAFPVYHNTVAGLPPAVGFFWFSVFALLTAFAYPRNPQALRDRAVPLSVRIRSLYPASPFSEWLAACRKGGIRYALLTGLTYSIAFAALLTALSDTQEAIVITALVISQIKSPIMAAAGFHFLRDTCRRWDAFILGTLIAAGGILLYKGKEFSGRPVVFVDTAAVLLFINVIFTTISVITRTKYRRKYEVDALDAMRSVQIVAVALSFTWMIVQCGFTVPESRALAGCAYLGIVPTAIAGTINNRAQDIIGVPATSSIGSLGPLLLIPISWIPLSAFHAGNVESLGGLHYAGILLTIVGLLVVFLIARPVHVEVPASATNAS